MQSILGWTIFGYFCGSIPFAVIIGRYFGHRDPRSVGDGNPGGTNVWISAGWLIGLTATVIEILKGWFPVWLARADGVADSSLIPVLLAPILGHATMPFLKFKGGKALGVTGGAWMGIIGLWVFPIYAAGAVPMLALQTENAYAALAGMAAITTYAFLFNGSAWIETFALLNTALIVWTHRRNLGRPFELRPWLANILAGKSA